MSRSLISVYFTAMGLLQALGLKQPLLKLTVPADLQVNRLPQILVFIPFPVDLDQPK